MILRAIIVIAAIPAGALAAHAAVETPAVAAEGPGAGIVEVHERQHGERAERGERGGRRGGPAAFLGPRAELDADGDGEISRAEVEAAIAARVSAADTDGDGALDLAEFQAMISEEAGERAVRGFARLDADESDTVTVAEITEALGRRGGRGRR